MGPPQRQLGAGRTIDAWGTGGQSAEVENGGGTDETLDRVRAVGPEWTGQEYVRRLREPLAKPGSRTSSDLSDIVFAGEGLPDDLYFEIILAAIDEAGADEDLLWCLGDGPVDHLADRDPRWPRRFHQQRANSEAVDLMFRVMQRYYAVTLELDAGWWSDSRGSKD